MVRDPIPPEVRAWADERDRLRKARDFAAADALLDRIAEAGYKVADTSQGPVVTRLPRYRTVTPNQVADRGAQPDGPDVSVLLLLEQPAGADQEPPWIIEDATRCLASVLPATTDLALQIVVLDNGVGGDAAEWAADAAQADGIEAVHLDRPVGFGEARALQHRLATGRVLLWLDTGVELGEGALSQLLEVFEDPQVGAAGRWGADLGYSGHRFQDVEPTTTPREVAVVWRYLLGLRRALIRTGAVTPDPGYRLYRNVDVDLSLQVRAAGARTVLVDLPAVQRVHRGQPA